MALRHQIRSSLPIWARFALAPSGYTPAPHHLAILDALTAVGHGETRRLMLLMPPGAAKSTYASKIFPAWWFVNHPESAVIAASHTAGLSTHFGHGVRALIEEHSGRLGVTLRGDTRAKGSFMTAQGGEYFAVGVHGAIAGRRADLALIDDPVRSLSDAQALSSRQHLWDWFGSDLITRLKPSGRVVVVMTRWHVDDLAGRLIAQGGWTVVRMPALAETDDPLGRSRGEALWPDWENREALLEKQAALGEHRFAAVFQQAPRTDAGRMFDPRLLKHVDIVPGGIAVRAWDLAATEAFGDDPDWTVGLKLIRGPAGDFYIDDVVRLRGDPGAVVAAIRATAERDGHAVPIGLPQDPGQAGRSQVMFLTQALAGYRVMASPETGSKKIRAMPVVSQVSGGTVSMRRASWNEPFLEEIAQFPHGNKDDQVDALSRAFALLLEVGPPSRFTNVHLLGR